MGTDNLIQFTEQLPASLRALFVGSIEAAKALYTTDDEFREICRDYDQVEQRLATLEGGAISPLRHEYATLRRDLTAELAERIRSAPWPSEPT